MTARLRARLLELTARLRAGLREVWAREGLGAGVFHILKKDKSH